MIRLRVLGALDLRDSVGQELRAIVAQPKRAALLAYLALAHPRGPHRRDTLLPLFWPEQDTEHARNALSQAVHFLRRSLGSEAVVGSDGDGLRLEGKNLWCDAVAFEEALEAGRLTDALDLYRGELLEGFHIDDAPEFDHWLEKERGRLAGQYVRAVESTAEQRQAAGDWDGAIRERRRLAVRDPYNSRVALKLMRALAAAGDPAGALQHARLHETLLREELDLAPDPEIAAFVRQLQSARDAQEKFRLEPVSRPVSRVASELFAIPRASVAVLPFLNLSADRSNEYFSEGMTEEILTALAKVPGLKVASRTSAFAFQGKDLDIREIADRLSVRAVLEGSVRRAGDQVRITAQLINAEDGYHLWSETYDREIADVFSVQEEISRAIVDALELKLSRKESLALVRASTSNFEAYELYLRGRFFSNTRTPDGLEKSIRYFEQAIAIDPIYTLAHSGLADSYHLLALYGIMRAHDAYPKAKAAALRAIEIDEGMAEGHLSLGYVALSYEWDWNVAEREFRRAIQLNPNYAQAHHWYAWFLIAVNRRDEALEAIRRAVQLEPLSLIILARAGHIVYYAGRPHEALSYCERALELDPHFAVALEVAALIHSRLSQLPEAVAALDHFGARQPSTAAPILLPYVHGMVGRLSEARAMVDALGYRPEAGQAPTGYLPLWVCATYALVGEVETAVRWLAYMYEERCFSIILCLVEPGFEQVRSDSRFRQWLIRIGLPDPEIATLRQPQFASAHEEQGRPSSTMQPAGRGAAAAPVRAEPDRESLVPHLDEDAPTPDELCARGRQGLYRFTAKSFAEGIRHAERAIQLDPDHAEAHVTLGSLYIVLSQAATVGNPRTRGVDLCQHAAALDPQLAEAHLWLGWASQLDERFENAEVLALRGLELDPGGLFSHSVLAWVRLAYGLKTGRWEKCVESIPSFTKALEIHPRDVHMPLALASLYRLAEQYCAAQLLLERLGDVERWLPGEMRMIGGLTLLGEVHLRRGHLDDARACLLRAVSEYSAAPQIYASYVNALTLCSLGDLERMQGHYDEAVTHYTRGRALLESAPALMGCGYLVVRLETRLAGASRLLRMRRKEELHAKAAREITVAREPYNFNWCWGVSEAELHYDWAVYHATCADAEATLQSLRSAIAYGWREISLLDLEPAFAFNRAHPGLEQMLDEARRRPPFPPTSTPIASLRP